MIYKKTIQTITNLIKVASKDETRTFLMGVNCRPGEYDTVILESTNGFCMNQTILNDRGFNEFLFDNFKEGLIINRNNEKGLKAILKEYKKEGPELTFSLSDNLIIQLGDKFLMQLNVIDRDYVKLDSILGNLKESEENFKIGFNFDLLKDLVSSMENSGKTKIITFNINKKMILEKDTCTIKPILVTGKAIQGIEKAVLMPCKV